jgi:hypothetical protein
LHNSHNEGLGIRGKQLTLQHIKKGTIMSMRIYTTSKLAKRAETSAIVSMSKMLDQMPTKECNTHFTGITKDYDDVVISKVLKVGKCVMVHYMYETDDNAYEMPLQAPINVLSSATILTIWEYMIEYAII